MLKITGIGKGWLIILGSCAVMWAVIIFLALWAFRSCVPN